MSLSVYRGPFFYVEQRVTRTIVARGFDDFCKGL